MIKYQHIDSVISDYLLFTGEDSVDQSVARQVAEDVVRRLQLPEVQSFQIVLCDVVNHKVQLPDSLTKIHQVAFRHNQDQKCKRVQIVEASKRVKGCDITVTTDCPCPPDTPDCGGCEVPENQPIVYDVDEYWLKMHPELFYGHMPHYVRHGGLGNDNLPRSIYHNEFYLIRPATHSFFNADLHVGGCLNLDKDLLANCPVQYQITGRSLTINVPDGQVIISYFAPAMQDGFLMIPDTPDMYELIRTAIEEVTFTRKARKALNPVDRREFMRYVRIFKQDRAVLMGRVREQLRMPQFDQWWTWLIDNYNTFNKKPKDTTFYRREGDNHRSFLTRLTQK